MTKLASLALAVTLLFGVTAASAQTVPWSVVVRGEGRNTSPIGIESDRVPLPGGDALIAMTFDGAVVIGGRTITPHPDAPQSSLVLRVDASGQARWLRVYEAPHELTHLPQMIATPDGGTVLAGHLPHPAVVRLDARGIERWRLPIDGNAYPSVYATPSGELLANVAFGGTIRLPGTRRFSARDDLDSVLASLDASSGAVLWARHLPGEQASHVVVASDGTITIGGRFDGRLRHGRTVLRAAGDHDIAVRRFTRDGRPQDAFSLGSPMNDDIRGLHVYDDGGVAVLMSSYIVLHALPGGGAQVRESMRLVGFDVRGRRRFEHPVAGRYGRLAQGPIGPHAILVQERDEARLTPDFFTDAIGRRMPPQSGMVFHGTDRLLVTRYDAAGGATPLAPIDLGGAHMALQSVRARLHGDTLVVGGAMTRPTPSGGAGAIEAFHVTHPVGSRSGALPASSRLVAADGALIRWDG